jgi:hypothetical protein
MVETEGAARAAYTEAFRRHLADPAGRAALHAAEFQAKVRDSDMRYAGEPLDVAYFPLAIGPEEEAAIAAVVERSLDLLERATRAFLAVPGLAARAYGWADERMRVVSHDPGYPLAIPCARFDAYWRGGASMRFLEVNTDGTSGMTNVERIGAYFLESPGPRGVVADRPVTTYAIRDRVLATLMDCYGRWRERHGDRAPREPRIAIVDWRTVKTSAEFRAFLRFFEERGLAATIADPRELSFDGARLRDASGAPIDLVYRRLVSTEVFSAPKADTAALLAAYLLDGACVIGSFRSDVAFDKRIMALLTDPDVAQGTLGLGPDDIAFAARVFPWTRSLRPGPVLEQAKEERERLVLKPAALYEGRGVRIGIETDPAVWRAALDEAAVAGDHVVQERIAPPELVIESFEDGRLRPRPLHFSLGAYAFGGALSGLIARVASTLVLSADDDERILPVVRLGPPGASPSTAPGAGSDRRAAGDASVDAPAPASRVR